MQVYSEPKLYSIIINNIYFQNHHSVINRLKESIVIILCKIRESMIRRIMQNFQ